MHPAEHCDRSSRSLHRRSLRSLAAAGVGVGSLALLLPKAPAALLSRACFSFHGRAGGTVSGASQHLLEDEESKGKRGVERAVDADGSLHGHTYMHLYVFLSVCHAFRVLSSLYVHAFAGISSPHVRAYTAAVNFAAQTSLLMQCTHHHYQNCELLILVLYTCP